MCYWENGKEKTQETRNVLGLDLNTVTESLLTTVFGSEFQTAGAEHYINCLLAYFLKAGMAHHLVDEMCGWQVRCCDPLLIRAIHEHCGDEYHTNIKHYNSAITQTYKSNKKLPFRGRLPLLVRHIQKKNKNISSITIFIATNWDFNKSARMPLPTATSRSGLQKRH